MANIKSAKKRIKVINTKTERNKAIKTKVKTYIKKVEAAIAANDKAAASEALTACISEISKATSKGIFHKNTAARKVSRLSIAVNGSDLFEYNFYLRIERLRFGDFFILGKPDEQKPSYTPYL